MTGYSRADTADNIANNKVANADDLDNEFNAVQSAFNASTGHTHDGTSGSGAPITKLGPVQDVLITASQVYPKTTNVVDLGTPSLQYKDLWIDGTANIDSLVADIADINAGTIDATIIGATTPAAASFTTVSSSAGIAGNITSSGTSTFATVDINGGSIDGTTIGATTPATAAFTTVNATSINSAVTSSNATLTGGSINSTPIGATTPSTGVFTNVTATGTIAGSVVGNVTGIASSATKLNTSRTISLSGDVSGSVLFDGTANANIVTTVQPNSVGLGTDTTGNYVVGVTGTTNQITVTGGTGEGVSPVLSLPSAVTLPGTLTTVGTAIIGGDLIVNGTTTTVNSNTVNIADSIVTLNSDEVGVPSQNAGIEIERGTSANVSWLWDEANDRWTSAGNIIHTTGGFSGNLTGNTTGTHTGAISSSSATITGGSITGITDLAIAHGGTGASTAAGALVNLGITIPAAQINNPFPSGGIIIWSGSSAAIPSGWLLCNGTSGTPNLMDRFVVGAGSSYAVGATGGANSVTLSTAEIPAHAHTFSATTSTNGSHTHDIKVGDGYQGGGNYLDQGAENGGYYSAAFSAAAGNHNHTVSGTTVNVGSDAAHENRPPYYALCYIMKV